MARTIGEIMNRELFSLRPGDLAERALSYILALGITAAPVTDDEGRPLGVLSLRDCVGRPAPATAGECMTSPATTVRDDEPIDRTARQLVDTRRHRLVVVDESGRAVGMVSAMDVVAALIGVPVAHPAAFPHYDRTTGLTWTDDTPLEAGRVEVAPEGAGLIVLVHGGAGRPESVMWAEATHELRTRLLDMLSLPQAPALAALLERGDLRFRAASVPGDAAREDALRRVAERESEARRPRNGQPGGRT